MRAIIAQERIYDTICEMRNEILSSAVEFESEAASGAYSPVENARIFKNLAFRWDVEHRLVTGEAARTQEEIMKHVNKTREQAELYEERYNSRGIVVKSHCHGLTNRYCLDKLTSFPLLFSS